jgi:hypothetical protein
VQILSSLLLSKTEPITIRIYKPIILSLLLCVCGNLSLTLWEEHRLKEFENWVLRKTFGTKMKEVTEDRRKLHNEELHQLQSSPSIIWVIKSRRMRWWDMWGKWTCGREGWRVEA